MEVSLSKYIPQKAVEQITQILQQHPVVLKIVNDRNTKHGDFKKTASGKLQITVNKGLNPYHFLLTLVHEIAHLVTFKKHKSVKPHGKEWKYEFQHLMLPLLNPEIFPLALLPHLANYFKNPKASTGSDINLSYALKQYDPKNGTQTISELQTGSYFKFNNRTFIKGNKRRTRIECTEITNNKTYLFNQNAEVKYLKYYE